MRPKLMVRNAAAVAGAACLLLSVAARTAGGEQDVPSDLQAAIITRLLGYDRALKGRAGSSLTIGILGKAADRGASRAQAELEQAFGTQTSIQGLRLAARPYSYTDAAQLGEWVVSQGVDVLYVTPGLEKEVAAIQAVCAERKVVGVSSVRAFVKQGLAIGVVTKGESAGLLVNLPAARAAGMDLDPKLLTLAEVIR
jgi:hypothetical protein